MNAKQSATIDIELLYLDLDTCSRCRGTDENLDEAIAEIRAELESRGVAVHVSRRHVVSEAEAVALGFQISPTIRVNGHDVQLDWRSNACGECTELAGGKEEVACRVWHWQGEEHYAPPVPMLVDAIRRAAAGIATPQESTRTGSPSEPIRRFFGGGKCSGSCCG